MLLPYSTCGNIQDPLLALLSGVLMLRLSEHTLEPDAADAAPAPADAAPAADATPAPAPADAITPAPAVLNPWTAFFDRPVPNLILRLVLMLAGTASVAFGIALSRATDLGVSAISCIPGVLSFATPWTIGAWTLITNILFVLVQVVLLRREYHPLQLLCIPFIAVFSWMIDLFVPLCAAIPMPAYSARMASSLVSCLFIALGVWMQKNTALIMLPGDGIVQAISHVCGREFGKVKVGFDVSNIALGAIISLVSMGGLYGVREGSVLTACLVGFVIRGYSRLVPDFERIAPTKGHVTLIPTR